LKSIFRKALEWDVILSNPADRYRLKGMKDPVKREIFESHELELFYKLLDHESERNRLMLLAASLGALRRGEVLGFGVDVIDFESNTVNITRSLNWDRNLKQKYLGPTKGKRDRKVIYPESFIKELRLYAFKQNELRWQFGDHWELIDNVDLLFRTSYGKIMHPQSFTNLWKKIRANMGIKEIDLHDLRHSAASYLIKTGTEMKVVQEFLGHRNIQTTMDTYVHTTPDDDSKPAKAFEKLL
ncbi:MAG TPA: site-specific integrase, partial [Sporosarcina psychrophila]|nr:site-specific integrase [Sporosarcina psychrophila]